MEESQSPATAESEPSAAKNCRSCSKPLAEARVKAMPNASLCVGCLERNGDVLQIRRYDEYVGSEEVQTYFKSPNPYLKEQLERRLGILSNGYSPALRAA